MSAFVQRGTTRVKTCLVVDDSRVVRKVARRILEKPRLRNHRGGGWRGCAHRLPRHAMPDAVLLDWTHADDGRAGVPEAACAWSRAGMSPPVVFCSAENRADSHPRGAGRRRQRIHHEAFRRGDRGLQVQPRRACCERPRTSTISAALVRARSGLVLTGERGFFAESRLGPHRPARGAGLGVGPRGSGGAGRAVRRRGWPARWSRP